MPKLVCVKCQCELKPECNDTRVIEMAKGIGPYKLWHADLWKCPGCNVEIVGGFGRENYAEHFEPDFAGKFAEAQNHKRVIFDYEKPQGKEPGKDETL